MMYPVYTIDVCFMSYAFKVIYVGAKDIDDLMKNFIEAKKYSLNKKQIKEIKDSLKEPYSRIEIVPHMFTDTPYEVLSNEGYAE